MSFAWVLKPLHLPLDLFGGRMKILLIDRIHGLFMVRTHRTHRTRSPVREGVRALSRIYESHRRCVCAFFHRFFVVLSLSSRNNVDIVVSTHNRLFVVFLFISEELLLYVYVAFGRCLSIFSCFFLLFLACPDHFHLASILSTARYLVRPVGKGEKKSAQQK